MLPQSMLNISIFLKAILKCMPYINNKKNFIRHTKLHNIK